MPKGRRIVSPEDRALFWQALHSGQTVMSSAKIAGISYRTAQQWMAKTRELKAAEDLAKVRGEKAGDGNINMQAAMLKLKEIPPVIPQGRLCERAKRGLEDFDYFRTVYLGRIPSPWQVDAAYKIVGWLESEEKEFLVLNCPPGVGKSTLFHDVAVWCICRNRHIRVMIGSVSQVLAKMYSRRIRETLERAAPLRPDPEMVARGLAVDAEGCLALDYGRFKPMNAGALWRAEEFIVEQYAGESLDNKEPTVSAYGIDSEFIGHRADLCLFDDVASTENSKESASRDKLLERWDSMAEARVDPGGLLAVIGQRLSGLDLYSHCLAKVAYDNLAELDKYDGAEHNIPDEQVEDVIKSYKYHHLVYKAYYEELDTGMASRRTDAPAWPNGPLLEPFRLSYKDLSYVKHNNINKYRIVYQQEDVESGGFLIDRVWATGGMGPDGVLYPGCIDHDRMPGYPPHGLYPPVISICSVDPSPTKFWGVQWWLYQPETRLRYLVDLARVELTAEELLGYDTSSKAYSGLMEDWQERSFQLGYPISHWIVEVNAAQRFLLAHDFVRKWQAFHEVLIIPHTTSRNKLDESLGIEALLPPLWRTGQVRLPSMRGNWKTLALVDEMASWSRGKKAGTDLVMAHWFAELHVPVLIQPHLPPKQWRPSWL